MKVIVLFGSEGGNAKAIARAIEGKLNLITPCDLLDMNNYDIIDFSEKTILIIVTSTYNSGPPQNASKFFRWLKNIDSESRQFENLIDIAVLGIGDTNYDEFCKSAKDFETQLIRSGASRLVMGPLGIEGKYTGPIGIADEGPNFNEAVESWINNLEKTIELILQEEVNERTAQLAQIEFIAQRNKWLGIFVCISVACLVVKNIRRT